MESPSDQPQWEYQFREFESAVHVYSHHNMILFVKWLSLKRRSKLSLNNYTFNRHSSAVNQIKDSLE